MRGKAPVWLALTLSGLSACNRREVYRQSETPPRAWDVAWLVPTDARGRPFASRSRLFQEGSVSLELAEDEVAFVVVGLALDALPESYRRRLDPGALDEATLVYPTATRERLESRAGLVADGRRLELDVDPDLPYFDLIGPKWADEGTALSSTAALSLAAQLPVRPFFCGALDMVDVTPAHDAEAAGFPRTSPLSLTRLPDGSILAAMRRRADEPGGLSALVRLRDGQPVTPDDVLVLPSVLSSESDREVLREVLLRPHQRPDMSSVWVLRLRDWAEQGLQERLQDDFLQHVELPSHGSWASVSISERLPTVGPAWGAYTQAAQSVAESASGALMVVGGRNSGVFPRGHIAIGGTSTAAPGFELYELPFSGGTNEDILFRAAALPDDPRWPGASLFAIGARRGEIVIARYDPDADSLTPLERHRPPADILAMVGAGYARLYSVPRPEGFELWAVGFQGLLVRRTARGDWENLTNRLQEEALFDEGSRLCTPLGYSKGRTVLDVARRERSALITLDGCTGPLLIRFDEADRPICVSAVRPPGVTQLSLDAKSNFEAVLATEDGYLIASRGGLRLMKVVE